jgi:hypothetical protein
LGRDFGTVYYYSQWEDTHPKISHGKIGFGLEHIEKVESPFDVLDKVDIVVFPENYQGPMQEWLVEHGYAVWGGRRGDELEVYREDCKEVMAELGLPLGDYEIIHGLDAVRSYLQKHKKVWLKMSKWRGTFESLWCPDYESVEPRIDSIAEELGPFQHTEDFIIEAQLDNKIEIGLDSYCIDGVYPLASLAGLEIKDRGYIGAFRPYSEMPKSLTEFSDRISDTLRDYGFRGFLSDELRIGKDQVGYMIDFCSRQPSPPGDLEHEFYTNISEIIFEGAHGHCVDPVPLGKYGVELSIQASWASRKWLPVRFPQEHAQWIKFINPVVVEGRHYIAPIETDAPEIGSVLGYGDSIKEAVKMAEEIGQEIKGYSVYIPEDALDEAEKEIEKMTKMGIELF